MPTSLKTILKSEALIFTLLFFLKLYFVRTVIFHDPNLIISLVTEMSSVLFIVTLIDMILKKHKTWFYILLDLLFSTVMLAMILYFEQFDRIVTFYAIYQIGLVGSVGGSVAALFKPIYLILYLDILVLLILMLAKRYPFKFSISVKKRILIFVCLLSLFVSLLNVYLKRSDEINTTKLAEQAGILNSEAYELYSVMKGEELPRYLSVTNENIVQTKKVDPPQTNQFFGIAKNKNLIVIQLESYQNFLLGLKVDGQEVTPNLNRLLKEKDTIYFNHFNTQIGQGNTSDAEFITNSSLYPLEEGAITTFKADKAFPSLPKLLEQSGYDTLTFHVDHIQFWNRDKLYPALGFNRYYDADFFGKDDIIGLGPSDEVLFNKALPVLVDEKNKNNKFYSFMVTLTSHNPFVIPADKDNFVIPQNLQNTLSGNYLRAAHYTDKALGQFFDSLKQNGLWDQTVIALYGDHFALNPVTMKSAEKQALSELIGHTYDEVDMFNIPLIVKVPGMTSKTYDLVGGQSDTLPTLANLMGITIGQQVHFGEDLLNHTKNLFPIRYYLPKGSFFNSKYLYISDSNTLEDIRTRSITSDPSKLSNTKKRILLLEEMADYYLNSLPYRTVNPTVEGH